MYKIDKNIPIPNRVRGYSRLANAMKKGDSVKMKSYFNAYYFGKKYMSKNGREFYIHKDDRGARIWRTK